MPTPAAPRTTIVVTVMMTTFAADPCAAFVAELRRCGAGGGAIRDGAGGALEARYDASGRPLGADGVPCTVGTPLNCGVPCTIGTFPAAGCPLPIGAIGNGKSARMALRRCSSFFLVGVLARQLSLLLRWEGHSRNVGLLLFVISWKRLSTHCSEIIKRRHRRWLGVPQVCCSVDGSVGTLHMSAASTEAGVSGKF